MNEFTQTLDARVRDKLLGCLVGIRRAQPDEALNLPGEQPSMVFLVAEGRVECSVPGSPPRTFGPDSFLGLRDALHQLPSEGTFVATEESRLLCFDPQGLRALAADAPPDVVAVIERLD